MSALVAILLGTVAVLATLVLYDGILAARRITATNGRLRLEEVARARGLAFRSARSRAAANAQALAVRRCLGCWRPARCDQAAAARDWAALAEICPNRAYLDSLRPG
jgi:hypothetical protein